MWCCLRDLMFCRFSRTPTCDGRTTDRQTDTGPCLVPRIHSIAAYSSTFYCTAMQAIWRLTLQHMTKSAWEQFTLASYSPNCGALVPLSPANIGQCAFAPTTEEQNRWSACTVPSSISSRMQDAVACGTCAPRSINERDLGTASRQQRIRDGPIGVCNQRLDSRNPIPSA